MILERNFWVTALALVCVFNSSQALADQNQSEVLAVADQALELITAENFAGLADLMLDDAITVSTALREGRHEVNLRTAAEQRLHSIGAPTAAVLWGGCSCRRPGLQRILGRRTAGVKTVR